MPGRNIIQVSEWEKIYYDDATAFTQKHWEALCHHLQQLNRNNHTPVTYFQIINKGIRFTSYVGAIQVGNLIIGVLPKTDKAPIEQSDRRRWQTALLQMLSECKWLSAHPAGTATLHLKKQSLLDVYLSAFLAEVEKLLHEGLLKNYEPVEGNQSTLKGQLLFSRQVAGNSIHQERFFTRSTTYDTDNHFNRILYQAVRLVRQLFTNTNIYHTAGSLLSQFPHMRPIIVSKETFDKLSYHRKTERYRQAMQFAEMLLLRTSPDIISGAVPTLSILFDMNALWEEWVYRQLKKEATTFDIVVQRQQSTTFWRGEYNLGHKTIRPDIVIKTANGANIIIDTKWKLPDNKMPDDGDLKQLFVYNLYWQCRLGILLYPATEENASVSGRYVPLPQLGNIQTVCRVLMHSIFKDGKMDTDFGRKILEIILDKPSS